MNCKRQKLLFSARLDGELAGPALAEFEGHLASCPPCADAWLEFQASIGALRALSVTQVSEEYTDNLVAAVLAAEGRSQTARSRNPWANRAFGKPLFSHGLALSVGAALVLIFSSLESPRRPEPLAAPSVVRGPAAQPAMGQMGSTLNPAVTERTHAVFPTPHIACIVQLVERVKTITLPAPAPIVRRSAELERALNFAGAAFVELCAQLKARPETLTAAHTPGPQERAPSPTLAQRPRRAAAPRINLEEHLILRREGTRLTLETRGSLDEVVPALIAELDDEDPRVGQLVQDRLREIWARNTGASWNEAPFGPDPTLQWTRWWAEQQTLVASAGV